MKWFLFHFLNHHILIDHDSRPKTVTDACSRRCHQIRINFQKYCTVSGHMDRSCFMCTYIRWWHFNAPLFVHRKSFHWNVAALQINFVAAVLSYFVSLPVAYPLEAHRMCRKSFTNRILIKRTNGYDVLYCIRPFVYCARHFSGIWSAF